MRYFILFGVTFILAMLIIFYKPYLGVYQDSITIEYNYDLEGYEWSYKIDNDCLKLSESDNNKWIFVPNKNGSVKLDYIYSNGENTKYSIHYEFKIRKNKIFWTNGYANGMLSYPNPV